jgi:hypothetical protein
MYIYYYHYMHYILYIHRCAFETAHRSNPQLSYRQRFEKTPQRGVPFQMFGGIIHNIFMKIIPVKICWSLFNP